MGRQAGRGLRVLLSGNDLLAIQAALDGGRQLELERSLGALRIRGTTGRASPVWLPHTTLARLEIWEGSVYSTKWCVSAEEVRRFGR